MTENKTETAETSGPVTDSITQAIQDQVLTQKLVETFESSLDRDAKAAYRHMGFGLFHSIAPDKAQRQLIKMGFKPKDALDHYNIGCVHAMDEKWAQAIESFQAALKLDGDLRDAKFNLALAQEKAGEASASKKTWNDLLSKTEQEEEAAEIRAHLKELA